MFFDWGSFMKRNVAFFLISLLLALRLVGQGSSSLGVELSGLPKLESSAKNENLAKPSSESALKDGAKKASPIENVEQADVPAIAQDSRSSANVCVMRSSFGNVGATGEIVDVSSSSKEHFSTLIDVSDFGAIPDDGLDDALAIRRAIASARGKMGVRLVFRSGVYDLRNLYGAYVGVLVENFDHLMFDGGGARFKLHSAGSHFIFKDCSNVVVNNLDFELVTTPYTGGRVTSLGSGYFNCSVFPQHNILEHPPRAINLYDVSRNTFVSGLDIYSRANLPVEKLSDSSMRVPLEKGSPEPSVGDVVIVRYSVFGAPALSFIGGKNIRVYNVNIFSHSGTGFYCENVSGASFDNANVVPKSDTSWLTVTADAMQLRSCRGRITVANCSFVRCGGDALSVNQPYWILDSRADDHLIKMKLGKLPLLGERFLPRRGDVLEFASPFNFLHPSFKSEVISAEYDPLQSIATVVLSRALPDSIPDGSPVGNESASPDLSVADCSIYSTRARGFSILAERARIEKCAFHSTFSSAIIFECDNQKWFEGCAVDSVDVEDCAFKECNLEETDTPAVIFAGARFADNSPSEGAVHNFISVKNCKFERCSDTPVLLRRVSNPTMKSNTVQ